MDRLTELLERKKKADSLPSRERTKWQNEYDQLVKEIEELQKQTVLTEASPKEVLQCKQAFNELSPEELVSSVYNRKITVNDYMEIVRTEPYEDKQLNYMIQFYNQYLLVRYSKAQELLRDGYEFNPLEDKEFGMLQDLIRQYEKFFKNKGANINAA